MVCTVTGVLYDPAGTPVANTTIAIAPSGIMSTPGGAVLPVAATATTDGSGLLSVWLQPGAYTLQWVGNDARPHAAPLSVPDDAGVPLEDALVAPPAIVRGPKGDKGDPGVTLAGAALASDASDTGVVTTTHTRAVLASVNGRATTFRSLVAACNDGCEAAAQNSIVAASYLNCKTGGNTSFVVASWDDCKAMSDRSAVIASLGQCSVSAKQAVVIASQRTQNNARGSLALGYGSSVGFSTANRKIHLFGETGDIQIAGALTSSHVFSDFAEMFENAAPGEIPPGTIVTELGGKVAPAGEGDAVLGVVSETAVVVAGDTPFAWAGRYLYDEWGRPIMDEIPDPDHEGDGPAPMIRVHREDPAWNPDLPQTSRRERRDEWTCVGLLGQVLVRVAENVGPGDRLAARAGVGVKSRARTGLRCMAITSPFDPERGFAIARCLVNTVA